MGQWSNLSRPISPNRRYGNPQRIERLLEDSMKKMGVRKVDEEVYNRYRLCMGMIEILVLRRSGSRMISGN